MHNLRCNYLLYPFTTLLLESKNTPKGSSDMQVELSRADFKRFESAAHVHLDYHIGVVSSEGQQYRHQGQSYTNLAKYLIIFNGLNR